MSPTYKGVSKLSNKPSKCNCTRYQTDSKRIISIAFRAIHPLISVLESAFGESHSPVVGAQPRRRTVSAGISRALPLSCHCSATVQRFIHNLTCYPRIQLWPRGHMQPPRSPADHWSWRWSPPTWRDRSCDRYGARFGCKIDRCSRKSHDSGQLGCCATCAGERPRFPRRSSFLIGDNARVSWSKPTAQPLGPS